MTGTPHPARRRRHARRLRLPASLLASLLACVAAHAQAPECKVLTQEHGLWMLPGCTLETGSPRIEEQTLAQLDYDDDGLAVVWAGDSFHYVNRQGRTQAVITWDNGPDPLAEGLMRGRVGARIGYFDARLGQAFPATFDFGWPFTDGIAQVCNGCRRGPADAQGHIPMEGGVWFHIDRQGRRVPAPATP